MTVRTLDDAVEALLGFSGVRAAGHSALAAMAQAMPLLGDPHERLRVVHVTGTSGKTSTAYFVRALLEEAGFTTGLTVSPHIEAINERVQIGGVPLAADRFCAYVNAVLDRLAPLRGHLTYFELVVSLALTVFAREQVEYAVVEVGIGGTRDATNVCRRADKLAVITPVGLDHTEKLGSTIAAIAAHKAGIIVPGGWAVVAEQSEEAVDVIRARADEIGAGVEVVPPHVIPAKAGTPGRSPEDSEGVLGTDPTPGHGVPACAGMTVGGVPACAGMTVRLPTYQLSNWALAYAAVRHLADRDGFAMPSPAALDRTLTVTPPARFEWFTGPDGRILLDGAHNPQKVAALVDSLRAAGLPPVPALVTLSTAPPDKVTATLAALAPAVSHLVIPEFTLGHDAKVKVSVPAAQVAAAARAAGIPVRVIPDLRAAWAELLADSAPDVLVTGSLYLAALVRPWLIHWSTR